MQLSTWSVWPNLECIDQVSAILTFVTSFSEHKTKTHSPHDLMFSDKFKGNNFTFFVKV